MENTIFETGQLFRADNNGTPAILRVVGWGENYAGGLYIRLIDTVTRKKYFADIIHNGNAAVVRFSEAKNNIGVIAIQDCIQWG